MTKLEQMCESKSSHYHSNLLELAARKALEALETDEQWGFVNKKVLGRRLPAITALREALKENEMAKIEGINMLDRFTSAEQAEQEPVGEVVMESMGVGDAQIVRFRMNGRIPPVGTKLYATPVRTKDLTDDEINQIINKNYRVLQLCRAIIAAHKEKNK